MNPLPSFEAQNVLIWTTVSSRLPELVPAHTMAQPVVMPVLQQVASPHNQIVDVACRLMTGQFDVKRFL